MQVLAVIPARWASSRFPGKPLAAIAGRPMIVRVWERARQARLVDQTLVATDDERIAQACREHGIEAVMTAGHHATGSDRLAEVAAQDNGAEVLVNVQGDEPLIDPASIDAVVARLRESLAAGIEVATAYRRGASEEEKRRPSTVHLVPDVAGNVMFFSRLPIPYCLKDDYAHTVHVGLYAYTRAALLRFAAREAGPVERAESLEQMRFLEYGERIACVQVHGSSIGVDEPGDIARVEAELRAHGER